MVNFLFFYIQVQTYCWNKLKKVNAAKNLIASRL
jgi:hypothetical protein